MSEVTLIPVSKAGEYLEVHPSTLANHKDLGWRECEKKEVAEAPSGDRTDGPTVEEFVAAGYPAASYPPKGYASRSTQEEIDKAIAAQKKPSDGLTVAELKAAIETKGISIPDGVTLKADLAALLDAAP